MGAGDSGGGPGEELRRRQASPRSAAEAPRPRFLTVPSALLCLPQRLRGQRGRHRQQDRAGHGSGQEPSDVRCAGRGGGPEGADQGVGREELPVGTREQSPEEPGQPRTVAEVPVSPAWGEPAPQPLGGSCPGPAPCKLCGVRWLCPWGGQSHRTVATQPPQSGFLISSGGLHPVVASQGIPPAMGGSVDLCLTA